MTDLPNRAELFHRFRAAALAVPNTRISAREIDRDGSDINLIAAGASFMGEEILNRMARALAGVYEDTARAQQLDRNVTDRKGIPRLPAAPAVGEVTLSRPGFAAGAGTIVGGQPGATPAPTRITTNTGIVYILTEDANFGALDLSVTVPVQAELAGLASEVDAGQAWSFISPPFDTTITIANAVEMAGASDEESDDAYRARAKSFFPTLRRGVLGAIEFGLRSTPGVASATAIEVVQASGVPACVVQGFILDALGRGNDTFAARAQLNLLAFRALGIPVIVISGTAQYVPVVFTGLTFDTAVITDTVAGAKAVKNAIVAAMNNLRPGQTGERSLILAAARSVRGVQIPSSALVDPAGDLIPSTTAHALRTLPELVTVA